MVDIIFCDVLEGNGSSFAILLNDEAIMTGGQQQKCNLTKFWKLELVYFKLVGRPNATPFYRVHFM